MHTTQVAARSPIPAIPQMGLGTFGRTGAEGTELILAGLEIGYRHLDTAQTYGSEESVGAAIARSGLKRDEVFITTKIAVDNLARVRESLLDSLDRLGTAYVDLALIHWPSPQNRVPMERYLDELLSVKAEGLTWLAGVSNFTISLLEKLRGHIGPEAVVNNQIEVHPFLQNQAVRKWCMDNGMTVTAYVPLAKGKVSQDPTLLRIAAKHDALASQVALAWAMQEGMIVIPATGNRAHLASNFASTAVMLTDEERADIARLDRGARIISPAYGPAWDDA